VWNTVQTDIFDESESYQMGSVMQKLDEIVRDFQSVGDEFRLELLLDYAEKLPPLPDRFQGRRTPVLNRVPECQTPVYLYVEVENQRVRIYADVGRESPTVRGLVSILISAYNGATPEAVMEVPPDLIHRLGLTNKIGIVRIRGLSGIISKLKMAVANA